MSVLGPKPIWPGLCQASIIGIAAINIPKQKIMNGRSWT